MAGVNSKLLKYGFSYLPLQIHSSSKLVEQTKAYWSNTIHENRLRRSLEGAIPCLPTTVGYCADEEIKPTENTLILICTWDGTRHEACNNHSCDKLSNNSALFSLLGERNAVIVRENKTTDLSTWGAYDLCAKFAYECKLLRERICCVKLLLCDKGP